jgi:hypothetical protein
VLSSAFGVFTNSDAVTGNWGGSSSFSTIPMNSGLTLQNMTTGVNSLIAQQEGWYLVTYSVDGSGSQNNYVTYQLQNASGTAFPNTSTSINSTANDLEEASLTTLLYLYPGDSLSLAAIAQNFGSGYLPPNGARITAVKISN